jgi:hypothetical protein
MILRLRRQGGGFSGKAGGVVYQFDTGQLPEASRQEVLALIGAANLSARPAKAVLAHRQSQAFLYSLDVSGAGQDQTLEFQLDATDEPLQRLVGWIQDEIEPVNALEPR